MDAGVATFTRHEAMDSVLEGLSGLLSEAVMARAARRSYSGAVSHPLEPPTPDDCSQGHSLYDLLLTLGNDTHLHSSVAKPLIVSAGTYRFLFSGRASEVDEENPSNPPGIKYTHWFQGYLSRPSPRPSSAVARRVCDAMIKHAYIRKL